MFFKYFKRKQNKTMLKIMNPDSRVNVMGYVEAYSQQMQICTCFKTKHFPCFVWFTFSAGLRTVGEKLECYRWVEAHAQRHKYITQKICERRKLHAAAQEQGERGASGGLLPSWWAVITVGWGPPCLQLAKHYLWLGEFAFIWFDL